ncbi:YbdD/YjiX family protein [Rhodococcus kronopolitis]|uniref:YbdD/YjiX family protein n=1 Tax=Rhodococcus kronopolitis TaxID=1460226 RepID=A0ABV9FXR5_9NOCA
MAGPRRAARGLWWWVTSVMGDHDYARYAEHLRRTHPGTPVPSEREYWRARYADQDAHPGARCC